MPENQQPFYVETVTSSRSADTVFSKTAGDSVPRRQLFLVAERWLDPCPEGSAAVAEALRPLAVPAGRSFLVSPPGAVPSIVEAEPTTAALALEPLEGPPSRLLVVRPPESVLGLRVNGHVAPPACLVRVGDQLLVGAEHLLHVNLYVRPSIGPPGPEQLGQECLLCRVPLGADATVFTCQCMGTLHLDSTDDPPLECARLLPECPRCSAPLVLEEGFAHDIPRSDPSGR